MNFFFFKSTNLQIIFYGTLYIEQYIYCSLIFNLYSLDQYNWTVMQEMLINNHTTSHCLTHRWAAAYFSCPWASTLDTIIPIFSTMVTLLELTATGEWLNSTLYVTARASAACAEIAVRTHQDGYVSTLTPVTAATPSRCSWLWATLVTTPSTTCSPLWIIISCQNSTLYCRTHLLSLIFHLRQRPHLIVSEVSFYNFLKINQTLFLQMRDKERDTILCSSYTCVVYSSYILELE